MRTSVTLNPDEVDLLLILLENEAGAVEERLPEVVQEIEESDSVWTDAEVAADARYVARVGLLRLRLEEATWDTK